MKTNTLATKTLAAFALFAFVVSSFGLAPVAQAAGEVATNPATTITTTDATLNGTNGATAATEHSFWVSPSTFSTASSTMPAGVYSTPTYGAVAPNTAFSAPLSSVSGLTITPNTTYYFAAWENVGGTWYPGAVLSFITTTDTTPNAFTFVDQTGVALSTVIESNQITLAGINSPTAISVVGGEYAINAGAYTAVAGTVNNGDLVKVRHTSSALNSTATNTVLDIGGVSDTFTSTTIASASAPTTQLATNITTSDATLNGTNGPTDATGHSFWASTSPYTTAGAMPAGVYSTSDLGVVAANTAFSTPLSSVTGLPAITPNTTYYFNAWSNGGGTWTPGEVLSFTTTSSTSPTGNVTTNPATAITSTNATLNGTNGATAATEYSFWGSPSTFSTASSTMPAGVYSTPTYGAVAPNTAFSAPLSSVSGLTITPNTTYYFAAWENVGGTWYPGQVLSFTTSTIGGVVVPGTGVLAVTSIETLDDSAIANGNFEDGWKYAFNITVPTNETNISMKFSNWLQTSGSATIPAANNFRISSAQSTTPGQPIMITAADTYSSPALTMTGDLDPVLAGLQVRVIVDARVPSGTPNGSYTTTYGVRSN